MFKLTLTSIAAAALLSFGLAHSEEVQQAVSIVSDAQAASSNTNPGPFSFGDGQTANDYLNNDAYFKAVGN